MATSKQNSAAAQRRAKAEQMRKAQKAKEQRQRLLLFGGVGIIIVAIVIALVVSLSGHKKKDMAASGGQIIPSTPTGTLTTEKAVTAVKDTSGITGVLAWDTGNYPGSKATADQVENQHVTGPVKYAVTPPIGGPHNATWMNAGVYTKPVPSERAVHNLEHGGVWITYNPNLPASEVTALTAFVTKQSKISESAGATGGQNGQSNRYIDLSPWATNSLPTPIVMSSWGHQLRLTSATDPRMQKFIDTFRYNKTYSPEFPGDAVDGVPVQTGGRPASDGGTVANPAGTSP